MDKLRGMEVHPAILIGAVALIAAVLLYTFWLRPAQQEAEIRAKWTTPEAAAARGPGAKKDPSYERAVEELRRKENANRPLTRRRD